MAGLVPAIHAFLSSKTWMPGTSSAKTRFALLPGHDELWCSREAMRLKDEATARAKKAAGNFLPAARFKSVLHSSYRYFVPLLLAGAVLAGLD
jgi:hypothetical protein